MQRTPNIQTAATALPGGPAAHRLDGETVIVTGAGSVGPGWGNGKAAAILYARSGANVVAVDRSASALAETRALLETEGGKFVAIQADVSVAGDIEGLIAQCLHRFGRIDVLHNNVGVGQVHGLLDTTDAEWESTFAVNLRSIFLTCRAVVPVMRRQFSENGWPGRIVNIGAVAGRRWTGVPMVAYSVSKSAIESLTRSVALEFAADGIRCNCVLPGLMETPMALQAAQELGEEALAQLRRRREAQSPTGRMGRPWDVAQAALYLASHEAQFVNGHALVVDGGQSAQTWSPRFADAAHEAVHA